MSDGVEKIAARLGRLHPKLIDLSLDRLLALLARLGHPERKLPPIIHVAGTNGKGSTCAFVRAMAEAAGLKVHVYTSPHLVRFNERIRLAGQLASDEQLLATMERIERMRFWCAFEIRRPSDGTLIVQCKQTLAMVRMPPGKPVPLPPDWSTRYAHLKTPRASAAPIA